MYQGDKASLKKEQEDISNISNILYPQLVNRKWARPRAGGDKKTREGKPQGAGGGTIVDRY